jgi:hypothetical protein
VLALQILMKPVLAYDAPTPATWPALHRATCPNQLHQGFQISTPHKIISVYKISQVFGYGEYKGFF